MVEEEECFGMVEVGARFHMHFVAVEGKEGVGNMHFVAVEGKEGVGNIYFVVVEGTEVVGIANWGENWEQQYRIAAAVNHLWSISS